MGVSKEAAEQTAKALAKEADAVAKATAKKLGIGTGEEAAEAAVRTSEGKIPPEALARRGAAPIGTEAAAKTTEAATGKSAKPDLDEFFSQKPAAEAPAAPGSTIGDSVVPPATSSSLGNSSGTRVIGQADNTTIPEIPAGNKAGFQHVDTNKPAGQSQSATVRNMADETPGSGGSPETPVSVVADDTATAAVRTPPPVPTDPAETFIKTRPNFGDRIRFLYDPVHRNNWNLHPEIAREARSARVSGSLDPNTPYLKGSEEPSTFGRTLWQEANILRTETKIGTDVNREFREAWLTNVKPGTDVAVYKTVEDLNGNPRLVFNIEGLNKFKADGAASTGANPYDHMVKLAQKTTEDYKAGNVLRDDTFHSWAAPAARWLRPKVQIGAPVAAVGTVGAVTVAGGGYVVYKINEDTNPERGFIKVAIDKTPILKYFRADARAVEDAEHRLNTDLENLGLITDEDGKPRLEFNGGPGGSDFVPVDEMLDSIINGNPVTIVPSNPSVPLEESAEFKSLQEQFKEMGIDLKPEDVQQPSGTETDDKKEKGEYKSPDQLMEEILNGEESASVINPTDITVADNNGNEITNGSTRA